MKKIIMFVFLNSCNHLAFQGDHYFYYYPSEFGYNPENIYIKTSDGATLDALLFKSKLKSSQGLVLHFHGNAQNITAFFTSSAWLSKQGYDVMIFDYKEYGRSSGVLNDSSVLLDGKAVLNWGIEYCKTNSCPQIIVYGQSLGGNIAMRSLADHPEKNKISKLILESSFSSYKKVGQSILRSHIITWPFQWLPYLLVSDKNSSDGHLKDLPSIPKFVTHSKLDPVVDFKNGQELFDQLPNPKQALFVEEPDHGNIFFIDSGKYRAQVLNFLKL